MTLQQEFCRQRLAAYYARHTLDGRRLTQEDIAARLGMSRPHVNALLNGAAPLSEEFAGRFALIEGADAFREVFTTAEDAPA